MIFKARRRSGVSKVAVLLLVEICLCLDSLAILAQEPRTHEGADRLWDAARTGSLEAVKKELDAGVDVNAATAYQSTALCFASDRGHEEVVKLLLDKGANPNVKDSFYKATPMMWAQIGKHYGVITLLLKSHAEGSRQLLLDSVAQGDKPLIEAVLKAGTADAETLASAVLQAKAMERTEVLELLSSAKAPVREFPKLTAEDMVLLAGKYAESKGSFTLSARAGEKGLEIDFGSGAYQPWFAFGLNEFHRGSSRLVFEREDGKVVKVLMESSGSRYELTPSASSENPSAAEPADAKTMDTAESASDPKQDVAPELVHGSSSWDSAVSSANWPGFRGIQSRGVADGQHPPVLWDVDKGENVAWKTPIAGFGNSCPVIWGDRLFITSASSPGGNTDVKIGHYGDVDSVQDESVYEFILYCLDKRTGDILWQRTCNKAKPAVRRHSKSSHANPTVVTDGVHVIAWFGSEGLYAFDFEGRSLWSRDLGVLDSGWFFDPSYQWGFGSSPTIYGNRLFIQCDIQKGSYVAALDLATGEEVWRTDRDEIPSWSTPIVASFGDVPTLITHGTRAARGYDARDGKLLWWIADHSEIVVPTPTVAHDLIFVASGYAPIQPIIAIRPEARGELKLPGRVPKQGGEAPASDPGVAWSTQRGGPYMPTPIAYGDFLYICSNQGILTCYRAKTGEEVYKKRLKGGETFSFTASPIAADGHLYLTSESGHIYVVRAGGAFQQLHVCAVGGKVLATPAISDRVLYVRTVDQIIALSESGSASP